MNKIKILIILILLAGIFSCNKTDYEYMEQNINGLTSNSSIVTAGNIYKSKKDELIVGKDSTVYIYSVVKDSSHLIFTQKFSDDLLEMITGDADNDGMNELIIVTGKRRYVETEVNVYLIKYYEKNWTVNKLYSKHSPRPQPTYLDITDYDNDGGFEILTSYFESKYIVETVCIKRVEEDWKTEIIAQERMAMVRDVGDIQGFKENETVVGRVYGDKLGDAGDAYIPGEEKIMLPVKRGVKAVKIGDGDNDGNNEIYVGDGWHQDYGKVARGRIARLKNIDGEFTYELIEDVKYQYEITQLEIADINRDGDNEILAKGNKFFRIYKYADNNWTVFADTIFPAVQFTIGDIYGDKYPEVIFSGDRIRIYNFGDINFNNKLEEEVITERIDPDSLIDKPAPELIIAKWYNGNFGRIHSSHGKVILLDFWATWCKPCIKMFPYLKKFQEKYSDRGLQIIGLTRLDDRQTIQEIEVFIENQNFAYPIGLSEESFNNLMYGVGAIPHVVLIDKEGIVRFFEIGLGNENTLEKEIVKLLDK